MNEVRNIQEWDEKLQKDFIRFDTIIRSNGYDPETNRTLTLGDAVALQNAAFMIPKVLTQFVQEGVEPLLIGANLLQKIPYTPGMQVIYPAVDVLVAREVGEGMALPTFNINVGGGQAFGLNVRRHGLALRIDKKFVQQASFPWLQLWMKLAGQALARHKEELIFSFITSMGTVVFDNDVNARKPTAEIQPVKGHTTGRNIKGQFNGSITLDDIFDMYAQVLMQGFVPDTLLVHPMTWLMWVKDPVIREFALAAGGGSFFANWTGNAAAQSRGGLNNFKGLGPGAGQITVYRQGEPQAIPGTGGTPEGLPQNQTSAPELPSYFGLNFKILVSPFVYYDPVNRLTNLMLFDSKNLGALIVDEEPHVNEWDDNLYNIHNIGIEESYGLAILNEGQAIAVAKNVKVVANEFIAHGSASVAVDASFPEATPDTMFGDSPRDVLG